MDARTTLLELQAANVKATAAILEQAAAANLACPRCKSTLFYRHGQAHGLQRYRCRSCSKTFNALTGTPLARLRHKNKWLRYMDCLLMTNTVRAAAVAVGVHKNTSFRWRHRFLTLSTTDRPVTLSGVVEIDEIYFPESQKGARHMQRATRPRGLGVSMRCPTSKMATKRLGVLIARDQTGRTVDFVTGRGPVSTLQLHRCLSPVLAEDTLLVSQDKPAYRDFTQDAGIHHKAVQAWQGWGLPGAIELQNVNAYRNRFLGWLLCFHGIATRYLPIYLGWRRALDAQRITSPVAMLIAAVGGFPHSTGTSLRA